MTKPIALTFGVIALSLLGLFWWWRGEATEGEPAVFTNDTVVLPGNTDTPESVLVSPEQAIQDEIEQLEREKAAEYTLPPQEAAELDVTPPQETESSPAIVSRLIDWGYAPSSGRKIDTVVLHSSYNSLGGDAYSLEKIIQIYKDYEVGAHYIINRSGTIYRLVADKDVAYHAGASKMPDGRTGVNDFSIGIEMINTEEDQYTKAQYEAVNDLVDYLKVEHPIKHVVGHSDIAPSRKTDPWNFDWKKLKD